LHTIEHPQGSIDARLSGLPVATHHAKLRVATAHEKASVSPRSIIIVIIAHGASAPVIPVAIPPVIVIMPAVTAIIVVSG
jgi:hypothetical protein